MITDLLEASIWDWDVFLSFRGDDTRYKFTDHLYHNLKRKHLRVFRDAEGLRNGDEISPSLVKAIEGSRVSVVIISADYASSNSCLDELVTILRCKEVRKQRVVPIFYEVDPSKVRYQEMDVHEQKYGKDSEKVQNWRSAMEKASMLKGESYLSGYEYEFIEKIVNQIMSFLGPPRLYVAERPVGLGSRISEFISLSESVCSDQNDVLMLGVYGIGGIGKTTFAKAIYNLVAGQFESACFVEVGAKVTTVDGLVRMQETILATILGEVDIKLRNIHEGVMAMQQRLQDKKILLILDDVDELEQLKKLAGGCNWFGAGSRVIITTRHQDLLQQHGVNNERTYELKTLDHHEALELFCWHAFKRCEPVADYADISSDITDYAQGLPLALEIIGADVCGKEKDEWESTLADHKSIISDDIFTRLKVSYDKLRYNVKQMFLDMACFFNGESWDYLEKIFDCCNFNPKVGMGLLKEKCFIRRQDGKVWMHNLVRDMGREIVRQESEGEPGKRSRLWHHEDVLQLLATSDLLKGTSTIQGLMLELPEHGVVDWNNNCFEKMINMRILIIKNARFSTPPEQLPYSLIVLNWEEYPSSSFPPDFMGKKLLDLRLGKAIHPIQLGYPFKEFENVKYLSFTGSELVQNVPNLSWAVNLIEIYLDFCCNLVEFDHDKGRILLPRLEVFSAMGCSNLRACPEISSPVLKTYNLSGCRRLKSVPPVRSAALQEICVQGSGENIARCFYGNEVNNYPVIFVPGETLPWFFQYVEAGDSLSFRIRRRVPTICVGFVLKPMSFSTRLSYEISMSLGDGLTVVRKGDFIQNSCRVLFCFLTNGLTEEKRILQDDWIEAKVNGVLTFSDKTERRPGNSLISECGAFVNSTGSHFEDVEFYTRRRQCDWALSYINAWSAVNIKTTTDKGTSFFEFDYVDGDCDDDFDVDVLLTVRETDKARLDLPIMGWVKLRTAGYGVDPGFLAVRDWTGRWLVGCSSRVSRMEYEFINIKKAWEKSQAKKILAVLQSRKIVRELVTERTTMCRIRHDIEGWIKEIELMLVMENKLQLRDIIEKSVLKMESMIMMQTEENFSEAIDNSEEAVCTMLTEMEHGIRDVIEKLVLELMGPFEMEHGLRDVIEKSELELMGPFKMKHGLRYVITKLMLPMEKKLMLFRHVYRNVMVKSTGRWRRPFKMEHGLMDVIEKSVMEIESITQMKLHHWVSDEIGKPLMESNTMERRFRDLTQKLTPSSTNIERRLRDLTEKSTPSSTNIERRLRDLTEKLTVKIEHIMQMEMEHFTEKLVVELMRPIKLEHLLRDVVIYSVREIDLMRRNQMEHGLWNAIQKSVVKIESMSKMEMEHGCRDTVEYVKPDMEFLKQMILVLHTELSDMKRGLEWARDKGIRKVIVESDSEDTIRSLVDGVWSHHPCSSLVKQCRQLLREAEEVCLRHVPLKPNQVVKYFTRLPDKRGELGKILGDFCGAL